MREERVLLQLPPDLWWSIDDVTAARLDPAVLGVVDTALELLRQAEGTGGLAEDVAEVLAGELTACAAHSRGAGRQRPTAARPISPRWPGAARGASTSRSGPPPRCWPPRAASGIELGEPAQRLVREAAFYTVQAQTAPGRDATLRRMLQPTAPSLAADGLSVTEPTAQPASSLHDRCTNASCSHAEPSSVGAARRFCARTLKRWGASG